MMLADGTASAEDGQTAAIGDGTRSAMRSHVVCIVCGEGRGGQRLVVEIIIAAVAG
jgi:hypothetical protein